MCNVLEICLECINNNKSIISAITDGSLLKYLNNGEDRKYIQGQISVQELGKQCLQFYSKNETDFLDRVEHYIKFHEKIIQENMPQEVSYSD